MYTENNKNWLIKIDRNFCTFEASLWYVELLSPNNMTESQPSVFLRSSYQESELYKSEEKNIQKIIS